ncbi:MAG: hypothetical protein K2X27_12285 [Candidatus Obscuribacterales bacterium]|nr:hypothetical protein [Candidatus Obscuribacterales bacterium]
MKNPLAEKVGLLPEPPGFCANCNEEVCLRQQLISMALGYAELTYCLKCLAADTARTREDVLETVLPFIWKRDCFLKPWNRYENQDYCPFADSCIPSTCFQKE